MKIIPCIEEKDFLIKAFFVISVPPPEVFSQLPSECKSPHDTVCIRPVQEKPVMEGRYEFSDQRGPLPLVFLGVLYNSTSTNG